MHLKNNTGIPTVLLLVVMCCLFIFFELTSTLSAFSIKQSACRRAHSVVKDACREVQHQAFCLTHLWVRLTPENNGEKDEHLWERKSAMRAHKNGSCIQNMEPSTPMHDPHLPLLSSQPHLQPTVSDLVAARKTENLQLSSHISHFHTSKIKMVHNGTCFHVFAFGGLWIQKTISIGVFAETHQCAKYW